MVFWVELSLMMFLPWTGNSEDVAEHVSLAELLGLQTLAICPDLLVRVETASCQSLGWI